MGQENPSETCKQSVIASEFIKKTPKIYFTKQHTQTNTSA